MANAARQKNYKHHKGDSAQRRADTGESSRRHARARPARDLAVQTVGDCFTPSVVDTATLRDDLVQILNRAKEHQSDKAKEAGDTQELSHVAQEKLALACIGLSAESPEDVGLMSKVAFALFNQDLIKISTSATPQQNIIESMCSFLVSAFKHEESRANVNFEIGSGNTSTGSTLQDTVDRVKIDILRALSAVLFEHGSYVKDSLQDLFQIIASVSSNARCQEQSEMRRMALNCMANLIHKSGSLFSALHDRMYELLLSNLASTSQFESSAGSGPSTVARRRDRGSERKLISSALRALHFLLQEDKSISTRSIPPLMIVICRFMFFTSENWAGQPVSSSSSATFAAGVIQRSSYSTPANIIPFTKSAVVSGAPSQLLDHPESSYMSYRAIQSSDSEYSDSESGIHQAQRRQHDGKVRLNALLCLQALARAAPKQLQPHWPKFLTSSSSAPMTTGTYKAPSLIGLISSDPILNVRTAACVVLVNILESSKQYLAMAEENTGPSGAKSQTSLLALSERVGLMSRDLHVGIALAMDRVDNTVDQSVVVQMIKCCSAIVANCSYEKMRPGLPLMILRSVERYLDSSEPSLQSATLLFLTTLLGNTSAQAEVRDSVLFKSASSENPTPALLSCLLGLVEGRQASATVRLEAWSTLRAAAQFHFEMVRSLWPRIDSALEAEPNGEDVRIRSAGLLFLEECSKSGACIPKPLDSEWWKDVLERHILKAFAEENPAVKALGCDCISNLSSEAYIGLPNRLQMLIMSLVLGTALDEHPTARAAACRTIGVFILFPSLREDTTHMVDMASTVLDLCRDPNLNVRVRASWAVGNLCDSLVLLKTDGQSSVLDEVLTLGLWTKIVRTALFICQDHEKLKSNGIRAIGGLLRVTFEGILERERHSLVKDAVYALIKNMEQGSLKGRWNACYAMQNVLLNPDFPIGSTAGTTYALESDMVSWTRDVYDALLHAIQQSKNFKVRINACAALTVPKSRAKYGDQAMLRKIVQVLMTAVQNLDEAQGEHEFGEFQYRGQLETKLLRCLDHLLQLTGGVASLDLELDPVLKQRIVDNRPPQETVAGSSSSSSS